MKVRRLCVRAPGRLCIVLVGLLCSGRVSVARAQGSAATIEVRVESPRAASGAADAAIPVQLRSSTDPSQSWSAELNGARASGSGSCRPGRYRLISGTVERQLDVASGDKLTVDITRTAAPAAEVHDMLVERNPPDRVWHAVQLGGARSRSRKAAASTG